MLLDNGEIKHKIKKVIYVNATNIYGVVSFFGGRGDREREKIKLNRECHHLCTSKGTYESMNTELSPVQIFYWRARVKQKKNHF